MTDQWRQEPDKDKEDWNGRSSVQAAIAFAFFSTFAWVGKGTIVFILPFDLFSRLH